ncbi:hypothetical protein scyTo_0023826, partial [Scyliorhinus torazame]|nr:hypothetical protein [Scyliorhinus torazame]
MGCARNWRGCDVRLTGEEDGRCSRLARRMGRALDWRGGWDVRLTGEEDGRCSQLARRMRHVL